MIMNRMLGLGCNVAYQISIGSLSLGLPSYHSSVCLQYVQQEMIIYNYTMMMMMMIDRCSFRVSLPNHYDWIALFPLHHYVCNGCGLSAMGCDYWRNGIHILFIIIIIIITITIITIIIHLHSSFQFISCKISFFLIF